MLVKGGLGGNNEAIDKMVATCIPMETSNNKHTYDKTAF